MSILKVDTINEKTSGNGVAIPGHVIQVVNGSSSTGATNTTDTYADTGVTATITPKFATSKILANVHIMGIENNVASTGVFLKLLRVSGGVVTDLSEWAKYVGYAGVSYSNHPNISYLDSPSTTSATEYKVQFKKGTSTSGNAYMNANSCTSTITLMEIAQ